MDGTQEPDNGDVPRVGLFATCLVDAMRPSVGFAAAKLLQDAGCIVSVPKAQTCCGQPAWNAGDRTDAAAIARQVVDAFEAFDYTVAPSGSCAAMLRIHYPALLADDPVWKGRADALAAKSWELVSFLTDICGVKSTGVHHDGVATYHDSCSGLRELGIAGQPRTLLAKVDGLTLREHDTADVCCGFGGTFCVKYTDIAAAMTDKKIDAIAATGAQTVLAGDLGCLMAIAGRARRRGIALRSRHVAEVLAGMANGPAIGEGE